MYRSALKHFVEPLESEGAEKIVEAHHMRDAYKRLEHQILSDKGCIFRGKLFWIVRYEVGLV